MKEIIFVFSGGGNQGNQGGRGALDRARAAPRDNKKEEKKPAKEYPGRPPKVERPVKENSEPKFDGAGEMEFSIYV